MSLKAQITEDMKNAMRAKETARLGAIRLLLSAMKQREVDERIELTDADVVSINFYQYSPVSLPLIVNPAWDKPFLIGEFHFGTLTEQGVWGPGLAQAKDVAHSARLLERFVDDCLSNPQIVGAHWFQYTDQPLSGRGDGENYRVGLVNIADVPYAPLIQSSRALGERMYETRSKDFSEPSP